MTTCLTFVTNVYISQVSKKKSRDVWSFGDFDDAQPSLVRLRSPVDHKVEVSHDDFEDCPSSDQKDICYEPTLRESRSIIGDFEMTYPPSDITILFSELHIGLGSKHFYGSGDFMKEHFDSRLPSHETKDGKKLPHIMTLIVANDLNHLKVNGTSLPKLLPDSGYERKHCVLFSLNCSHEVLPVTDRRISFVFPIYGVYNPMARMKQMAKVAGHSTSLTRTVHEHVEDAIMNEENYDFAMLEGYIKALDDFELNMMTKRLRDDDSVPVEEKSFFQVSYRNQANESVTWMGYEFENVSPVSHLKIKAVSKDMNMLQNIKLRLEDLIKLEDQAKTDHKDSDVEAYYVVNPNKVPKIPFVVLCRGRYFSDQTEADLVPIDAQVFQALKAQGRKVEFLPNRKTYEAPKVIHVDDLCNVVANHKINYVSKIQLEFDDGGNYDPHYTLVYGIMIVE